jgi:hypothetical protein
MNYKTISKIPEKISSKTAQTLDKTELIEKTSEKNINRLASPSAVKFPFDKGSSPRVNFDPAIKKINFDMLSDIFSKGVSKRKIQDITKTGKKFKINNLTKAYVEFIDPELQEFKRFECYPDKMAVQNKTVLNNIAQNECDDDCATKEELKIVSKKYLADQLTNSLMSVEDKRKTL